MLCLMAFCSSDSDLALQFLEWTGELRGCPQHDLVLVADAAVDWGVAKQILDEGCKHFRTCKIITNDAPVEGWIPGSNSLFRTAALEGRAQDRPWLFLEPDAVPLRSGWLDAIEAEYNACGRPFMGGVVGSGIGPHLEGVAIYPSNALDRLEPVWDDKKSWVVFGRDVMLFEAHNSPLFCQLWGDSHKNPPTFVYDLKPDSPQNTKTPEHIPKEAVLFHRNKDSSLIRLLRRKLFPDNVFIHGGDVGDLMYGLPAMVALGPGALILHHHGVRESFTEAKAARIIPLLKMQPYFTDVWFQHDPPKVKWDFNKFRQHNWDRRDTRRPESLAESHCRVYHIPEDAIHQQWLFVDKTTIIEGRPVVIHRSPRYHNASFPWPDIIRKYKRQAVFVGLVEEHIAFCKEFGVIPRHATATYLDLARVIAGARLFIGNQSCPYAMAEGFKQNAILEACPGVLDCQFSRGNLANHPNGSYIHLPDIS